MTIPEIKQRLSIEQVLRHYGITINRNGHIQCPFHDDKKASMKVYLETNTAFCFAGSCPTHERSVDVIDFIMYMEKCTKREAILKAKEMAGGIPAMPKKVASKAAVKKEVKTATGLTLNDIFTSMQNGFSRTKKAQEYAAKRGLNFLNLELGYSSGQLHYGKDQAFIEDLQALQILKPLERGYLTFGKGCIIFPLKDSDGRICSLYGRKIDKNGHYYLTGRSGLYPNYPAAATKKLLLVESIIDAATLLQIKSIKDQYSILALYGTNGLTTEHQAAIKSLEQLESISIMLDGDEAGRKAGSKIKSELQDLFYSIENKKVLIKTVDLPADTDVNELWVNHQSEDLFLDLLNQSTNQQSSKVEEEILEEKELRKELEIINPTYLRWQSKSIKIELLGGLDLKVLDSLRATLRVSRNPKRNALDTLRQNLDLYQNGQLKSLLKKLHEQLDLPLHQLQLEFAELIEALEVYREEQQQKEEGQKLNKRVLSKAQKARAASYLKAEKLMENTWRDLGKVGIVGERENAFILFLCYSSRKMDKPLHIISLGSSGSGKTHLQESVAGLMPEEEVISVTSLSDNALYYFESLKNMLVLLEDMDGMSEEGLYGLRELKSKGFLEKRIAIKDHKGEIKAKRIQVLGPICFAGCTTKERVYEDNANRCLLLYRDETKAHKSAVMAQQRKVAAGRVNELEISQLQHLFKDCQMLLKPIRVVNPYAEDLVLPEKVFKPLRTNAHYLKFIEVITWYHQLQRPIKTSKSGENYIETTLEDIKWANELLKDVLLRKSDELSWVSRQFLERVENWLCKNNRESFRTKELRADLRLNPNNLKRWIRTLCNYGYLKTVGGNTYRGFEYQLTYQGSFEDLENQLSSALDQCLEQIKLKNSGSVGQSGSKL